MWLETSGIIGEPIRRSNLIRRKELGYNRELMPLNLSGLLLPITTPFTAGAEIDFAALQSNIERWNQTGISGYVVLGSTGERVNLNERAAAKYPCSMQDGNFGPKRFPNGSIVSN